jgi:hypothetical protein
MDTRTASQLAPWRTRAPRVRWLGRSALPLGLANEFNGLLELVDVRFRSPRSLALKQGDLQISRAIHSAIARLAVSPGDSIPKRLTNPATP